jgi:hypothetical protein
MVRAKAARAMALVTRVACDKEGDGNGGKSDGNKGGGGATATRVMATEGEQQSTSDGINKGGQWLAREHQRGNLTTMTVGDDERRERAVDDDGSNKEGKGGKGDGDSNEGGGQQRGQGQ